MTLYFILFYGWHAPCLVTWQWLLLMESLCLHTHTHTHTHPHPIHTHYPCCEDCIVLWRGHDLRLHFSALLVLPNCHLYPPPHLCLPLSISSVFVSSKTNHGRRTEKDTAEKTRVKSRQRFRTWQLHRPLKTLQHDETNEYGVQTAVQVWQQFLFDHVNISNFYMNLAHF